VSDVLPARRPQFRRLTKRALKFALEMTLPLAERLTGFRTARGDYLPHRLQMLVGRYEREELTLMRQLLKAGQVVIDVGANVGYITRFLAETVGNRGRVYALEPNPTTVPLLRKNVSRFENVFVDALGLSSRTGELPLYSAGTNRFVTSFSRDYPARHVAYQDNSSLESVRVPVITGDEFIAREKIQRVDAIKIDVEGWELDVLEGFQQKIQLQRQLTLFIEFNPAAQHCAGRKSSELFDWLFDRGFSLSYPARGKLCALARGSLESWLARHDPNGFSTIFALRN
jgi:FkbM family methyltransferase